MNALRDFIRAHPRLAVLTGAGVSTSSGIPDYRDLQGDWKRARPVEFRPFMTDPKVRQRYWARSVVGWPIVSRAQPNGAHRTLARLEEMGFVQLLITQNVDGLHRRAGSRNVVELHGNIARVKCSREHSIVEHWTEDRDAVPRCAGCGALLRPDVVWFEETLPPDALQAAEDAARRCQILLVVGTSAEVYPAAALPAYAKSAGATIVEINPNPTPLSDTADYVLRAPAGAALPALVAAAWPV